MAHGIQSNAAKSITIVLFISALICSVSLAENAPDRNVLILPFNLPDNPNRELQSFKDHLDKVIRAALEGAGPNYQVVAPSATEQVLSQSPKVRTDSDAIEKAVNAGSDIVIFGFISQEEGRFRMKATMWDLKSGKATVASDHQVNNIHELSGLLQLFVSAVSRRLHGTPRLPFYRAEISSPGELMSINRLQTALDPGRNLAPWRSPEINSNLIGLDIGDLDGDGKNETVLVDDNTVTISRFENGSLVQLAQISDSPAVYLGAEVKDLDNDGVAELIVWYQTPKGVDSGILTYKGRSLKKISTFQNRILKVVRSPEDRNHQKILGQITNTPEMFSGRMETYDFRDGKLEETGTIALPPDTLLLSYDSGKLGQSEPVRAILNQNRRLMIFDQENRLLSVSEGSYGLEKKIRIQWPNEVKEVILPGRLLINESNIPGLGELLLIKHAEGGAVIQALRWADHKITETWKTIKMQGVVNDFEISDFKNQGIRSLVMLTNRLGQFLVFSGNRSIIYAFDLHHL